MYICCETVILIMDCAISTPRKYSISPHLANYFFMIFIPFWSSPVMTMSSTYTLGRPSFLYLSVSQIVYDPTGPEYSLVS